VSHTQGPWEFNADRDEMTVHVGGGIIASIFTPDDSPCFDPETEEESEKVWQECIANGHLLAAAPQLLAIAKIVVEEMGVDDTEYYDDLVAAIKKAEGKS
jgi:hypothetical protein